MNCNQIVLTLVIVLIYSVPCKAELFDGERAGFILGAGVGYAAVQSSLYAASGFTGLGKIGYGLSDQFSLHLTTLPPSFTPSLGFNYFSKIDSPLYLHGGIGYGSADSDSNISISGGLGYEFHQHLSLEGILALNRYSDTYTSQIDIYSGQIYNETTHYNFLTLAVTFNFSYY